MIGDDVARAGEDGATRCLVDRARGLLDSGRFLESRISSKPLRLQLALYRLGGLAICDAIERYDYRTGRRRPRVSAATKVSLVARAAIEAFRPKTAAAPAAETRTAHPTK
ncbi:MAG: hypothetical protein JOY69_00605 [Candidatus Eremiobacteraeota bacterium]|nr:hypothetical protein [Candidatus Eremiobacteraeota bacterium]